MTLRFLSLSFLVFSAGIASAQPVSDPNGRITGSFGDQDIDLPVLCVGNPVAVARSHQGNDVPGVAIGLPNGPSRFGSVEIRTAESEVFTSAERGNDGFPTTFAGEADGITFDLTVDCPEE